MRGSIVIAVGIVAIYLIGVFQGLTLGQPGTDPVAAKARAVKEAKARAATAKATAGKLEEEAAEAKAKANIAAQESRVADYNALVADSELKLAEAQESHKRLLAARAELLKGIEPQAFAKPDAPTTSQDVFGDEKPKGKPPAALVAADSGEKVPAMPVAKKDAPKAAPDAKAAPATIRLTVPAGAKVSLDGMPTTSTGPERTYSSPPIPFGETRYYSVAVDGAVRQVAVRAGETTAEDFTK